MVFHFRLHLLGYAHNNMTSLMKIENEHDIEEAK